MHPEDCWAPLAPICSKALPFLSHLKHSRLLQAVITHGEFCLTDLSFAISTCLAPSKHPEAHFVGLDDTWHILVLFLFLQASLAFVLKQKSQSKNQDADTVDCLYS